MASVSSSITPGMKVRSLGIIKDRTNGFQGYKEDKRRSENRFQKKKVKNDLDRSVTNIDQNQRLIEEKNLHDTPGEKDTSGHFSNSSHSTGTSSWKDLYEDTLEKLHETENLYKDFLRLKEQRIKKQFGNQSDLDSKLEDVCRKATSRLSQCEANISQIAPSKHHMDHDLEGDNRKVRENLQKALASRVQEQAKLFRMQEKALYDFLVKLNGDKSDERDNLTKKNEFFEDKDQAEMMEELHEQRDEQVNKLVTTLNKLAQVFKQMNELVIEQGTVLDRIDYNMEQTLYHTKKGTEQLVKANIAQASGFAAKCRKILMVLILVFTFILVLKYTS